MSDIDIVAAEEREGTIMSTASPLTPWTPAQPDRRQGERRTDQFISRIIKEVIQTDFRQTDRRTALQHYGEQAALAEALRDAARYRWLRAQRNMNIGACWIMPPDVFGIDTPEQLDAAIDQQLAASAGKGEK